MEKLHNRDHVMVDLETLSVQDNPVVLSISAVKFDIGVINKFNDFEKPDCDNHTNHLKSFHAALEIDDQIKNGLSINSDTIKFHLEHNRTFLEQCIGIDEDKIKILSVQHALEFFSNFITSISNNNKHYQQPIVWANGAVADHKWLASLYNAYGLKYPVYYNNQFCYRTILSLCPEFKNYSNNHDSFDDCVNQIIALQNAYKRLGF